MGWSILSKFSFTHPHLGIYVCRMQENRWWMITAVFLTVPDTWNINLFYELCSKQTILPLFGNSWISKGFHWNIQDFLSGSLFWVGIWNQSFMFHIFSKLFNFYFENHLETNWPSSDFQSIAVENSGIDWKLTILRAGGETDHVHLHMKTSCNKP